MAQTHARGPMHRGLRFISCFAALGRRLAKAKKNLRFLSKAEVKKSLKFELNNPALQPHGQKDAKTDAHQKD